MECIFVLLSDIHFTGLKSDNLIFEKKESLVNCIKSKVNPKLRKVVFLVNGDIACFGRINEYKAAISFFKSIIYDLKKTLTIKSVDFIFSPGNHDCNFESYTLDERKELSDKLDHYKLCKNYNKYNQKTDNYENFIKKLNFFGKKTDFNFFSEYQLEKVIIVSYNSTLAYDHEFKTTGMIIDSRYINDNLSDDKTKIYISLSHYPLEWFDRSDENNYQGIFKGMNLVITSHEHKPDSIRMEKKEGKYLEIRLPAFNPTDQQAKTGFMIMSFNNEKLLLTEHQYNGSLFTEISTLSETITSSRRINENLLYEIDKLKEVFDESNILSGFDSNSTWNNFFVKPTLVKLSNNKELKEMYQFIEFDDFDRESDENLKILTGKQFIGKTTILYNLVNKYINMELIPIYVDASKLQNDIVQVNKSISKFISKVYFKSIDYVYQNFDKVIVLIDNAHSMKSKFKSITADLVGKYKKIIMTANSQLFDDDLINNLDIKYDVYDIMPFGNNQKYQLIENWVKSTSIEDEYRMNQKINEVMSIVNKIDNERNFMNTPTLLIVFLEAYEDKKTDNLMNGSKGVYYEYLIDKQIIHLSEKTGVDSNFIEKYLSEFAYMQYSMSENFNEKELDNLFLKNYPISNIDYYTNVSKLKKIFRVDEVFQNGLQKGVYFTNDLVFSYFVAKHLQKKLHSLKDNIRTILDNVNNPINSNILLFYLYFTQDPDVIDQVVDKSNSLFPMHEEVKLDEDIDFINKLIIGYKDIGAVENVRDKNQELNKKIDKIEYYRKIRKKGEDDRENNPILIERSSALRIADITTEVLNLFPNVNLFNKLVESTIKLSLRKTSDLVMLIYSYLVFLSDQTKEYIEKNSEHIDKYFNRLLSTMVMIFVELSENLKNKKTKDFTKAIVNSLEKSTSVELLKMILDVYFQRGEEQVNYDFVIKQKEKVVKSNNKFAAGMIHLIIEREVNYVGMQTRAKNELLKRLNIGKIQRYSSNPRKQLDNIKNNRKERLRILRQTKK